jgi:hypothetical protein
MIAQGAGEAGHQGVPSYTEGTFRRQAGLHITWAKQQAGEKAPVGRSYGECSTQALPVQTPSQLPANSGQTIGSMQRPQRACRCMRFNAATLFTDACHVLRDIRSKLNPRCVPTWKLP